MYYTMRNLSGLEQILAKYIKKEDLQWIYKDRLANKLSMILLEGSI